MQNKYKYAFVLTWLFCFFFMIISSTISNSNEIPNPKLQSDYSDELKYEPYDNIKDINGYYDAIDTFFYDSLGSAPKEWKSIVGTGCSISVNDIAEHKKVLSVIDAGSGLANCTKYFYQNVADTIYISFWFRCTYKGSNTVWFYRFRLTDNTFFSLENTDNTHFTFSSTYQTVSSAYTWNVNQWYYAKFSICRVSEKPFVSLLVYDTNKNLLWNTNPLKIRDSYSSSDTIQQLSVYSGTAGLSYTLYLDALDISVLAVGYNLAFKTQIKNIIPTDFSNFYVIPNAIFSLYDTFVDTYPNLNNNFRTTLLVDNILNNQLLNKQRLIRLMSTSTTRKLHIIQLLFENLNNSNAFKNNLNQSINVRIDTFDVSNNLINKFYVNLEFNQSNGILEWFALYRKSLAIPYWQITPTNPIINFADYLAGQNLTELQINLQFYLIYTNLTQMYIMIRTDMCFNNRYDMIYSYDKIINAGNSAFYASQNKVQIQYIDYFNKNDYTEVITSEFEPPKYLNYTYNCLKGIRTLELNSTLWKFNFLNVGFFKTELDYYIPPTPPEPDPEPEPPQEPKPPKSGMKYWTYQSYSIRQNGYNTISLSETIPFFNESVDLEYETNFALIESYTYTAKFYYEPETFKKTNWKMTLDIGLGKFEISFNWLRDILLTIVNGILYFFQFLLFCITIALNYLIMFIIVGIIVVWLYNYIVYWLFVLVIFIVFYLYCMIVLIGGLLWTFIQWLYWIIILPFITWFLIDFLPILIEWLIVFVAFILALLIWCATLCQSDFDAIYTSVYDMLTEIKNFMFETTEVLFVNLPQLLLYIFIYLWLLGLYYIALLYCKFKGYVNRVAKIIETIEGMLFPLQMAYKLILKIKEVFGRWT